MTSASVFLLQLLPHKCLPKLCSVGPCTVKHLLLCGTLPSAVAHVCLLGIFCCDSPSCALSTLAEHAMHLHDAILEAC